MTQADSSAADGATGQLAERITTAAAERRPLRVVGGGTWMERSAPIDATEEIRCDGHDTIIEYVPGDLTITVGGGVTLGALEAATAANDQWLTLDPYGSSTGTIGATIATASAGPLATGFGLPRDLMLGFQAVTGSGKTIRAGGRVVKNVAGFDLTRLFTGSRGTLGIITEVSLRLRSRPPRDETVAVTIDDRSSGLRSVSQSLRSWPFTPMAAEVIDRRCAAKLGLPEATTLLVRLGGNARAVASQKKRVAALGRCSDVGRTVWSQLRSLGSDAPAVVRVSDLPAAFAERWDDAQVATASGGMVIGTPSRGVVRCFFSEADRSRLSSFRARTRNAAVIYESLPSEALWNALTTQIEAKSIHGRVRAAFDPVGIMNPGAMRLAR